MSTYAKQDVRKTEVDTGKIADNLSTTAGMAANKLTTDMPNTRQLAQQARNGEVPSTEVMTKTMDEAKSALDSAKQSSNVNATGEKLLEDTKGILSAAQDWVKDKNADDNLQKLAEAARSASKDTQKQAQIKGTLQKATRKVDMPELQQNARALLKATASLSTELASSPAFRSNLNELFSMLSLLVSDNNTISEFLERTGQKQNVRDYVREIRARTVGKPYVDSTTAFVTAPTTVSQKQLTDQQLDQLQSRLFNLLKQITVRDSSKQAANNLLAIGDSVVHLIRSSRPQLEQAQKMLENDKNAQEMLTQSRTLFERIAGGYNLDNLISKAREFQEALENDQEAKTNINAWRGWLRELLANPEKLNDNEFTGRGRALFRQTRTLLDRENSKYRMYFNNILDELSNIVDAIQNDPKNIQLQQQIQKLVNDMFVRDDTGLHLREGVVDQLRLIFSNLINEQLREVNIPPLHVRDEDRDIRVSNIKLNFQDLAPSKIKIDQDSHLAVNLSEKETRRADGKVVVTMENMYTHLKGLHFDYKGLSFPRIEESGIADLDIGGAGMSVRFMMAINKDDKNLPIKITSVDVDIDQLSLQVQHTKRDYFWNTIMWMFNGVVRRKIQNAIQRHLEALAAEMNEAIQNASSTIQQVASDLSERKGDIANWVSDKAGDLKGQLQDTKNEANKQWQEFKQDPNAKMDELKQKAGEKWDETKQNLGQKKEEVKQNASAKWEEVKGDAYLQQNKMASRMEE